MRRNAVLAFPLFVACAAPAQNLLTPTGASSNPAPDGGLPSGTGLQKVVTVEGMTEYRLDNGLRVLLFPDASKPTVLVNITYLVGSRQEGYGETGMAHLLEHMMFKGTPTYPDVWKSLTDHGANFNGSTWWDRTNYYEELPASPKNLEFALALEADRMVSSRIAAEDLAKEFSVVRNEFEMAENQAEGVLLDKMMAAAFQWHNYGKSTIGSRSDIERVPIKNLQAFYRRYYRPDNAVLIVVGKYDEAQALAHVAKYFGAIPRPAEPLHASWTVEPVQDGERMVILRRTGDVPLVSVLYHGVAGADPDRVAEEAIVDILTNKPSGRLYKALVGKGLASEVTGTVFPMTEPGVILFTARLPKHGAVEKVREIMQKEIESLGRSTITSEELGRWRAGFNRDFELILNETVKTGVVLSEFAAMGDWRLFFLMRDQVKATTTTDVTRVASAYLKPSNRTLGLFLPTEKPDRAPLPPLPDVAAMVKDYRGSAQASVGEAFVATIENIEARTTRETLPGGLQLALLPKKTKGGQVNLSLVLRYGTETDLVGKNLAAALLPEMLSRGSRKHTFQQIKDRFSDLKAEVAWNPGSGPANLAQIRVKTVRESLLPVLDLVFEILREPVFPKNELESLRKEVLAKLEEQRTDPMVRASVEMLKRLSPYDPKDVRYIPSIEESIARLRAVTIADMTGLYKRLWGASATQVSIVGDFDPEVIRPVLSAKLGSWKSPKPYQRIPVRYLPNQVVDETLHTPDKEMAFVTAGQSLEIRDDDPAYPALFMMNYILGGNPTSRLFLRLRQQEGISYGTFSQLSAHPLDKSGFFSAGALAAPGNMDRAMTLLTGEIERVITSGVTESELSLAKQSYAQSFEGRLAEDEFILFELNQGLFLGRTLGYWKTFNSKIQTLTVAEVHTAAKTFLNPARLTKIRAGDQAKKDVLPKPQP